MTSVTLTIPLPPSLNNIFFNRPHGGRSKTTEYKNWVELASWEIRKQRPKMIEGDAAIHLTIERPNAQSDLDNRIKAVLDALQKAGVLKNDRQIVDLHAKWGAVVGAVVNIRHISERA